MNLPKNVGDQDRNIRFVVGGLLVLVDILSAHTLWLSAIGAILVGTAYMRTCMAYVPLGIDTTKKG